VEFGCERRATRLRRTSDDHDVDDHDADDHDVDDHDADDHDVDDHDVDDHDESRNDDHVDHSAVGFQGHPLPRDLEFDQPVREAQRPEVADLRCERSRHPRRRHHPAVR